MKKYQKRRTGRSRRSGRSRIANTASRYLTSTVPRQLYPMLPAQLKVSLRRYQLFAENIGANAYALSTQNLVTPVGSQGTQAPAISFPEYFTTLHAMYGRSIIDRVQVKITLTNLSAVTMTMVVGVAPQGDNYAANIDCFERMRSYPESKSYYIGSNTGGHDVVTHYMNLDVKKYLNYSDETPYTTNSIITPNPGAGAALAINPPVLANIPQSPMLYLLIQNLNGAAQTNIQIALDFTVHATFSSRHAGGVINNAA